MIVPVDKASNNFGIVCKFFYLDVIKNLLGISKNGKIIGNKVYKPVYQEAEDMKLLDNNQYIYLYCTGLQNNMPI